ncbi:MAG: hypothetical protein V7L20_23625 [Nostoc sp.]|uniref:hypothetical protein n=1 Tax=Nostoc sp. TaxID=1180 RepID=UPI002FFACECC
MTKVRYLQQVFHSSCLQCPMLNNSLLRLRRKRSYAAGFTTMPNSTRGCALSVAMPQALRLPRGQAQYKSAQAELRTSSVQVPNAPFPIPSPYE